VAGPRGARARTVCTGSAPIRGVVDATPPAATRPLARQLAQWRVLLPFYARAVGLQGSHPTVARALLEHSSVFDDPWGRVARTTSYALRLIFGDDRRTAAAELRELHRGLGGEDDQGRPYHPWDPDVWAWVHLTTAEALLYAVDVACGPWPRRDLEAFYAGTRRVGALYGVRESDMPGDLGGLRAYVDEGVATLLRPNPGTERLRDAVFAGDHLRALGLPAPAGAALRRVLAGPTHALLFGAFPEPVRRLWGVRWTRLDQARYVALLVGLRAATAPLPDRARMLAPAYRVLHHRRAV
jgi:uncharacterized protein (DUF2236 family)